MLPLTAEIINQNINDTVLREKLELFQNDSTKNNARKITPEDLNVIRNLLDSISDEWVISKLELLLLRITRLRSESSRNVSELSSADLEYKAYFDLSL